MKRYELTEKELTFVRAMLEVNRTGPGAWESLVKDNFSCVETSDLTSVGNKKVIAGLISSLDDKGVIEIEERRCGDLYWFTTDFVKYMASSPR